MIEVINISINDVDVVKEKINLCLGYFDGLHLGHQDLVKQSFVNGGASSLLTFDFNSSLSLKNKKQLTSIDDKKTILGALGVKYLIVLKFTEEVKNLTYQEFIAFLQRAFNINYLVVGEDFRFGKDALGNIDSLKEHFIVKVVPLREINHEKVSTSLIIKRIEDGDVEYAKTYLGRYYKITNTVLKGNAIGRTILFPTANIDPGNYVIPRHGVYSVLINLEGKTYKGFCNVGVHPTVKELKNIMLEVHIFDFNEDIYYKPIDVYFVNFIREEQKYPSLEALEEQLKKDKITALKSLSDKTI